MILSTIAGVVTVDLLAEELKEPTKKSLGWLFNKAKDKGVESYDEHKLNQALNNISDKITRVTKVKTIYKGDEAIDLHEFYVPTKIDKRIPNINCINDISKHRAIVLEGTVGQGKSIFMRYLTYQEARQGQRVPIFFELRRLEENQSLANALSRQISNWVAEYIDRDFSESDFKNVAQSGKLVLFLDGFDELSSDKVKRILNEIEAWCERYFDMQIVISSRPYADIQRSNYFKIFQLSEYRFYEQSVLIDKLVEEKASNQLLKQAIRNSKTDIQQLLKTPLMVTLLAIKYKDRLEIPCNQYEFYTNLFHTLVSWHDRFKKSFKREFKSRLDEFQLQEIFEEFCFITFSLEKSVIDNYQTIEILNECLENQGFKESPNNVLDDLSRNICLLLKDGLEYSFVHKSIQEFYYASFISKQPEMKIEFYKDCDFEFSKNKINILNFLQSMDTYYYYKYLAIPIFDKFIEYFDINGEDGELITYFYYDKQVFANQVRMGSRNTIQIIFANPNHFNFPFYLFKELSSDFVDIFNKNINFIRSTDFRWMVKRYNSSKEIDVNKHKILREILPVNIYDKISQDFLILEKNILRKKQDMIDFINKKNPTKYKKYLNKK